MKRMASVTTAIFLWKDAYNLGIPEMDQQHQGLVRILNALHASMSKGSPRESLEMVLRDLIAYTERHFKCEEQLMVRRGYSGLKAHQAEHQKLTKEVHDLRDRLHAGKIMVSLDTMNFLKSWLTNHIMCHDKAYAKELAGAV